MSFSLVALGLYIQVLKEKIAERDKNLTPTKQKREHLMYRIIDYINEHYAEPLTLKKISEAVYISEAHLSHYFKKDAGLSPMQYLMHRIIGEAQSMLIETSKPIQDIGEELGFVSSAHFSKMFKKYVGITPKEYRNHFIDRKSFFGTTHYYANHSRLYKNFFRGGFLNSKHSQNCDNVRAKK